MIPGRIKTSLAELEHRLRRTLRLQGDIGADFNPVAVPVVLVDDATRPGANVFSGRHWMAFATQGINNAGATQDAWKAQGEVIIDQIIISHDENALPYANPYATFTGRILPAGAADPFVITTAVSGAFVESVASVNDKPPLLYGSSNTAFGGVDIFALQHAASKGPLVIPVAIHLRSGDRFCISNAGVASAAAANVRYVLSGRLF